MGEIFANYAMLNMLILFLTYFNNLSFWKQLYIVYYNCKSYYI